MRSPAIGMDVKVISIQGRSVFRLSLLIMIALLGGAGAMADLFLDETFAAWNETRWEGMQNWHQNGWRFFTISGAQGALVKTTPAGEGVLRLIRENDVGDSALDLDHPDFRLLLPPKTPVFIRVWARQTQPPGGLKLRLAEYAGQDWLSIDNEHVFRLTREFAPYTFQTITSENTTEVSLAIRVQATGSIEIQRLEVGPVESAAGLKPRILLPQGITPDEQPLVWWKSPCHAAFQIQLGDDLGFASIVWDSQSVISGINRQLLPPLATGKPVFARVRVMDFDSQWSEWSDPVVIVHQPQEQLPPQSLVVYDLNPTRFLPMPEAFEQAHLVSVLQGLVNRQSPQLFLRWMSADDFWLSRLREKGRWMEKVTLEPCFNLKDLLLRFQDYFQGVVLWDPEVPATSNLASTIAGVENLLPIPKRGESGSLYEQLVKGELNLPVVRDLTGMFTGSGVIPDTMEPSSGSAKNDAYRWAIARYLESGKCNPARLGYYMDYFWAVHPTPGWDYSNHTLTNHDFFVMHKGFLWDLSVWEDEAPNDDPGQPLGTDYATLLRMFKAAAERLQPGEMIHCGGFTPWAFKYTDFDGVGGRHNGVQAEWETVRLLSAYNGFLDADALGLSGLANASVYWHMPRPERTHQSPPPLPEECRDAGWLDENGRVAEKTYVIHYVGDYDAAAWLTTQVYPMWRHFRRGQLTLPWAWNPNLMERGAPMFDEFIRTRTPWDYLWSGDNGAGYLNPTQLLPPRSPSGMPDGVKLWQEHCARWFRRLNLRHVGFIINGRAGDLTRESLALYEKFAGDGVVAREIVQAELIGTLPVIPMMHNGLPEDPRASAREIAGLAKPGEVNFLPIRSVLREPGYYYNTNRAVLRDHPELEAAFLNPAEFFYLLRHHLGGENHRRAAFLYDTLPGTVPAGVEIPVRLWIQNRGWDSWQPEGERAVQVAVEIAAEDQKHAPQLLPLTIPVKPGEMMEMVCTIRTPQQPGAYFWRVDLLEGTDGWFSESGNLEESRRLLVVRAE